MTDNKAVMQMAPQTVGYYGLNHNGYEVIDLKESHVLRMFDANEITAQPVCLLSDAMDIIESLREAIAQPEQPAVVARGAEIATLREALESIERYGLDTLSGRTDGPDDRNWQRQGVNEMTKRAQSALYTATNIAQPEQTAPVRQPLTDRQAYELIAATVGQPEPFEEIVSDGLEWAEFMEMVRVIEAAHGIKAIAQPIQPEQERLREALEQIANESVRNLGSARIVARHALAQFTQTEQIAKPFAWCIESTNSADWSFSATEEGVKSNALLMDADCIKNAPFPLYKLPAIAQPEQTAEPDDLTIAYMSGLADGKKVAQQKENK